MGKAAPPIGCRRAERIQIPAVQRHVARMQHRIADKATGDNAAARTDIQIPLLRRGGKQPLKKRRVVTERRMMERARRAAGCRIQVAHPRDPDQIRRNFPVHSRFTSP